MLTPPTTVDQVLDRFREHGHRMYGEQVTELEHALQCATFAERAGEPPVVVAAALLHDFGHLCHGLGEEVASHGVDARHELLGHAQLQPLFIDEIAEAGRLHVAAKRYLCWKEPGYFDGLSDASRQSLALQGGVMTADEAHAFEEEPHHALAVQVRRYDDMGKVPGMHTPGLEHFAPLLEDVQRASPGLAGARASVGAITPADG
jgi:[1-hydroxy-2-(trimethylamino)ethyl]phosphonate dioxygenase